MEQNNQSPSPAALPEDSTPVNVAPEPVVLGEKAETIEEVLDRHRKEQRALQETITSLRKSTPRNNKQKKRETQSRISALENELIARHQNELKPFQEAGLISDASDDAVALDRLKALIIDEDPVAPQPSPPAAQSKGPKKNRQKQRLERRAAEMQRMREEAALEASTQVDMAAVENAAINELLVPMKLKVHEITADGHCLYNAISNQLLERYNIPTTYKDLRKVAADYMRAHPDDFIPFLVKDDGDMYSPEDFEKYCNDIEHTARWGGQLEILAIAKAKQVPIHIIQMGSPTLKINEEDCPGKAPLKLAYHKHLYSLGAHYNSLLDADN